MDEPFRILIAEDAITDAELAQREIRSSLKSCEFKRVDTRADFLAALESFRPDLILSDYRMPNFDGMTALKLAQQHAPLTPVIIWTGSLNEDIAVECMKAGASNYVLKERIKRLGPAVIHTLEEKQVRIERARAEESLRLSEEKHRTLVEEVNDGIYVTDTAGVFTFANPALARMIGLDSPKALIGRKYTDFVAPEIQVVLSEAYDRAMQSGHVPEVMNGKFVRPDGSLAAVEIKSVNVVEAGQIIGSRGVVRDVTARRRAEEALATSEAELRALFASMRDAVFVLDREGIYREIAPTNLAIWYIPPQELLGKRLQDVFSAEQSEVFYGAIHQVLATKQTTQIEYELLIGDQHVWYEASISPMSADSTVWVAREITERKRAEGQIQNQLNHMAALREIDIAIGGSFDLRVTLKILLQQVIKQLQVHAADILLLDPNSLMLTFGAGMGLNTREVELTQLRLGDSFAGRVALEQTMISISDLGSVQAPQKYREMLKTEEVVSYIGVPLIAKGKVKGVLEVLHREPLHPDKDWFEFLNTLAGQAAIALDNAGMFDNLQRSNTELFLAYDSTIEGWSHALDLRDKETEGHTKRVTEMTLRLARAMGMGEDILVHIRRGALLHDIGKMGVPDAILLKPAPLTDEEWVVMHNHPTFAFELLSPIKYLSRALEIPYCHHEKWDGTGYPRGLKGDQIPLAARLFAVVDVWDALHSDRPYRKAWEADKVREHIKSLAGTHFDPEIVDAFFRAGVEH